MAGVLRDVGVVLLVGAKRVSFEGRGELGRAWSFEDGLRILNRRTTELPSLRKDG